MVPIGIPFLLSSVCKQINLDKQCQPRSSCCVLEQDTLLPESTGNAQEAVAPSRHD